MSGFVRRLRTLASVEYANMLEYRAELILWAIAGVLPFIMLGLWSVASEGGGLPLDQIGFARYFLAVFVVRQLTYAWVIYIFEFELISGALSPKLLLPMNPIWRYLMSHLAEQAVRIPFGLLIVGVFFALYPEALWRPSARAALAALGLGYAAFALRFLMQYTIAMLSFWIERSSAVERIAFLPYLFLSGMVAPLELFPDGVRRVVELTPYPYLVYVPAKVLTGAEIPLGRPLAVMAAWFGVTLVCYQLLWRLGLRRYSAMGA